MGAKGEGGYEGCLTDSRREQVEYGPTRDEVRELAACPACGAVNGDPCVGVRGKPRASNHRDRIYEYEEQMLAIQRWRTENALRFMQMRANGEWPRREAS